MIFIFRTPEHLQRLGTVSGTVVHESLLPLLLPDVANAAIHVRGAFYLITNARRSE